MKQKYLNGENMKIGYFCGRKVYFKNQADAFAPYKKLFEKFCKENNHELVYLFSTYPVKTDSWKIIEIQKEYYNHDYSDIDVFVLENIVNYPVPNNFKNLISILVKYDKTKKIILDGDGLDIMIANFKRLNFDFSMFNNLQILSPYDKSFFKFDNQIEFRHHYYLDIFKNKLIDKKYNGIMVQQLQTKGSNRKVSKNIMKTLKKENNITFVGKYYNEFQKYYENNKFIYLNSTLEDLFLIYQQSKYIIIYITDFSKKVFVMTPKIIQAINNNCLVLIYNENDDVDYLINKKYTFRNNIELDELISKFNNLNQEEFDIILNEQYNDVKKYNYETFETKIKEVLK
jgi:hypothetical protein